MITELHSAFFGFPYNFPIQYKVLIALEDAVAYWHFGIFPSWRKLGKNMNHKTFCCEEKFEKKIFCCGEKFEKEITEDDVA